MCERERERDRDRDRQTDRQCYRPTPATAAGESCSTKDDCADPNAACDNGICACKSGMRDKSESEYWTYPDDITLCVPNEFRLGEHPAEDVTCCLTHWKSTRQTAPRQLPPPPTHTHRHVSRASFLFYFLFVVF